MNKVNYLWTLNNGWEDITIYPEPTCTEQIDDNLTSPYLSDRMEFQDEMDNTVLIYL